MPVGQCNVVAYGFGIENGVDQKDRGGIGGIFFLSENRQLHHVDQGVVRLMIENRNQICLNERVRRVLRLCASGGTGEGNGKPDHSGINAQ